jgi:hypothetical protein
MRRAAFIGEANTGIGDRHRKSVAIDDGKEHGPQGIGCGIDGFLIAKLIQIICLPRFEKCDIWIARTVHSDVVMVGNMA